MLPRHHIRRAVEATAIGCVVGHVAASACGLDRLKRVTRPPLMLLLAAVASAVPTVAAVTCVPWPPG